MENFNEAELPNLKKAVLEVQKLYKAAPAESRSRMDYLLSMQREAAQLNETLQRSSLMSMKLIFFIYIILKRTTIVIVRHMPSYCI